MAADSPVQYGSRIRDLTQTAHQREEDAQEMYLRRAFRERFAGTGGGEDTPRATADPGLLLAIETIGFDLEGRRPAQALGPQAEGPPWQELLWPAYRLRLFATPTAGLEQWDGSAIDGLFAEVVDGVMAQRQPELRYRLNKTLLGESDP